MTLFQKPFAFAALTISAVLPFAVQTLAAQTLGSPAALSARITAPIDNASRVTLPHSHTPLADAAQDRGAVAADLPLSSMSLVFSRSPQQEAALQALLVAQQQTTSPLYHQWLTPEQYAAQFGVADADLAAAQSWLQQQGFTVNSVGRSRNRIVFSGTAGQVAAAFGTTLHNYTAKDGSTHFAPSTDLSIPAALSGVVLTVQHLSSFMPKPFLKPAFTYGVNGAHLLTPGDVRVIYDVNPVLNAGYTGANQSIAVIGESYIYPSDIAAFAAAAGINSKPPVLVLVPGTGVAAVNPLANGDEAESDLDVEYSSTMAPGAQVYFVYTGDTSNSGVFSAIEYAIDERIAPIVTLSYGGCEQGFTATEIAGLDSFFSQAASQGQTILASAGDSGATACYGDYTNSGSENANNYQVSVNYPASSPYITAMGGTEIPLVDSAASNSTYFTASSGTDIVTSAKSYIPEQVWNDDASLATYYSAHSGTLNDYVPASGGGGVSALEARPSWQTGTIGGAAIPAGAYRLLPDISLLASNFSAPLLLCTSDQSFWNTAANGGSAPYQTSSCTNGFRDASSNDLIAAGGTSFDAPIFAGMLALINQARNATGQGLIGSTLYGLAANSTTYASAFHDITVAGNQCLLGSAYCGTGAATTDYPAAAGYDEASGLGSIDLNNLLTAWPKAASASLLQTAVTVSPAAATILYGATDAITINVAQLGGTSTLPGGTVNLVIDGTAVTTLTLSSGSVSYTYAPVNGGTHVIVANYTGDTTHAASTASASISVNAFTLAASNVTVTNGSSANSTLTVTPLGSFTGAVSLEIVDYTGNLTNFCIGGSGTITVATAGTAVSEPLTVYTSAAACAAAGLSPFVRGGSGKGAQLLQSPHARAGLLPASPAGGNSKLPAAAAFTCLLLTMGLRRRKFLRSGVALGGVLLLALSGFGITGCSNSAAGAVATTTTTTSSGNNTIPGTYTVILEAQDAATGDAAAGATLTVTVQ